MFLQLILHGSSNILQILHSIYIIYGQFFS